MNTCLRLAVALVLAGIVAAPAGRAADLQPASVRERLVKAADDFRTGDHASAWFRFWALAQEGDAAAQFNLGQLYREGMGVPADFGLARYWYAEAAAQGHAFAQYNLGIMYERGDGTPADLIEARAWYRRAAAQDLPAARSALDRLERLERQRQGQRARPPGVAELDPRPAAH